VFLTTGAVESAHEFWWDELSRIVLESPTLPAQLELEVAGQAHRWRLDDLPRETLHLELWDLLRRLGTGARRDALAAVSTWAGAGSQHRSESRALDPTEVRRLIASGLVEIGAHTVTHPSLPLLDRLERRAEIDESRRACAELAGREVDAFAYPYGDLDDATVRDVRDAGFAIACSVEEAVVTNLSDPLRLPRVAVGNWNAADLLGRLSRVGQK
jgi:peptidoglycan/xylan/chitin deacetylase (PgdA/CDA1 family)